MFPPPRPTHALIQLHHDPGSASLIPHILQLELALPFELLQINRAANSHKSPACLAMNPNGSIPVLVDGGLVLYETAATCLHLADGHLDAGFSPPLGSPERAYLYKWLAWLTNTLQTTLLHYFYPERMVNPGDTAAAAQVRHQAPLRVGALLDQFDAQLQRSGGPLWFGPDFGLGDIYAFVLCRWTRNFSGPAAAPARSRAVLATWLEQVLARPAVQRALAESGLNAPFV